MSKRAVLLGASALVLLAIPCADKSLAACPTESVRVSLPFGGPEAFSLPRPEFGAANIPLTTTFYIQLQLWKPCPGDSINTASITITLNGTNVVLNGAFQSGYQGTIGPNASVVGVAFSRDNPLSANTTYTFDVVSANSVQGAQIAAQKSWSFTTEGPPGNTSISSTLSFAGTPVNWTGVFYGGLVQSPFGYEPVDANGNNLFDLAQQENPKAFSVQRGGLLAGGPPLSAREEFWGVGIGPSCGGNFSHWPSCVVQELETRRIVSIADDLVPGATSVTTVDFYGHEQYGIPNGRWVCDDYQTGDLVIIADRLQSEVAQVAVCDVWGIIWLHQLSHPASSWSLTADYAEYNPLPGLPGKFPAGGTYIYPYNPAGTPMYYWGRLDAAGDLLVSHGRKVLQAGLTGPPGGTFDVVDGKPVTIPKDWAQFHQITYDIAEHIIERYPTKAASWKWGLFNEPDLDQGLRAQWDDAQRMYDYFSDAVLRAFEDNGFNSSQIKVGGLEFGAIGHPPDFQFPTGQSPASLETFFAHCSPTKTSTDPSYVATNAVCNDPELIGPPDRRSARVKSLCAAYNGKGCPLDYVSIHAYNRSEFVAAKLIKAKQLALGVDAAHYSNLAVDSGESSPGWSRPPDPPLKDTYAGDGYLPSWTMDFVARLLAQGQLDSRYTKGDTAMTLWGFPDGNMSGTVHSFTSRVGVDTSDPPDPPGNEVPEEFVDVKEDIFHAVSLLASMGDSYYLVPPQTSGGHVLGGFATKTSAQARVMLYSHNALDYETRSGRTFTVNLTMTNLPSAGIRVRQYRIDNFYNSYFPIREVFGVKPAYTPLEMAWVQAFANLRETAAPQTRCVSGGTANVNVNLAPNGVNFLVINFQPTCVGAPDSVGLYNPTTSTFRLRDDRNGNDYVPQFAFTPGANANTPIAGDWNNDGVDTIGLTTPFGTNYMFYERNSNNSGPADIASVYDFWNAGWQSLTGDWNGDGLVTEGTMNPANNNFGQRNLHFGFSTNAFSYGTPGPGVRSIAGDWNGDGIDTIGLYDPSTSTFHLRNSNSAGSDDMTFQYGTAGAGWIPIAGDWDGNGVHSVGLYDPVTSRFHLRNEVSGATYQTFVYGTPGGGLKPIAGCWRGK